MQIEYHPDVLAYKLRCAEVDLELAQLLLEKLTGDFQRVGETYSKGASSEQEYVDAKYAAEQQKLICDKTSLQVEEVKTILRIAHLEMFATISSNVNPPALAEKKLKPHSNKTP